MLPLVNLLSTKAQDSRLQTNADEHVRSVVWASKDLHYLRLLSDCDAGYALMASQVVDLAKAENSRLVGPILLLRSQVSPVGKA